MPYIKKSDRKQFDKILDLINEKTDLSSPGLLNYLFTNISLIYLTHQEVSYQSYNDIIGVLECVKLEMYRRKVSKYEDKKIKENGDVY